MRCFEDIRGIYRREGPIGRAVMVAMLVSAVIYGGSKPGLRSLPPPNEEAIIANTQFTVAERTLGLACVTNPVAIASLGFLNFGLVGFEATSNAVAKTSWLATGVYDDYFTLTPSADAPIRIGTNEVRRLMVFSHGFAKAMLENGGVLQLEQFRAPMSFIAQGKWAEYGVTSRCWTASSPASTIIAWENALLNRDPAQPLSFQMEFLADGDLVYRYGDSAAINSRTNAAISLGSLSSPPWADKSLSITGTIARASSLHFANVAAYGDGTGDADNDGLSDYEELMLHGTNPNEADTDGDGLADLTEVNGGTNPFDPDEDNDGVADGISTNALAAILAPDASSANLIVAFGSSASTNGSATPPLRGLPPPDRGVLTIDSVPLIIQAGTTLNLNLPTGRTVNFNFVSLNYLGLDVSVSGNGTPVLIDDGEGFFRGGAKLSASGSLLAGSLGIYFADAGVTGPCVHEYPGTRRCRVSLGDDEWGRWKPFATITGENADTETLTLHVADDPTSEASLQIYFPATMMLVGGLEASISMHRCEAGHGGHEYCRLCGDYPRHSEGLAISPSKALLGVGTTDNATFTVSSDSYVQYPTWSISPQANGMPTIIDGGDHATVYPGTQTGVYTLTASGEGVSASATVIVYGVDYLTIESDAFPAEQEVVHFPGMTPHPFDVTHSPVPDLHQPFFYKDAQTDFVVAPFSVELKAHLAPDCVTDEEVSCEWSLVPDVVDGTFEEADKTEAQFTPTTGGGVYRFTFSCGSVSNSEAVLVLPLSGARIDEIVLNDIARADAFAERVVERYSSWERNSPENGCRWFLNWNAGDYVGRPNNTEHPTIWAYNQVDTSLLGNEQEINDNYGLGACGTLCDIPIRLTKISNFAVGYACERIGVSTFRQILAQLKGTWNDTSAWISWNAGREVANGEETAPALTNLVRTIWAMSGDKGPRLWPNSAPPSNYTLNGQFVSDPDHDFGSPGFLNMNNP